MKVFFFFGKRKVKHSNVELREGKSFIENEQIADRWEQYIEELHSDSEELKELERKEEITPKNWVQQ